MTDSAYAQEAPGWDKRLDRLTGFGLWAFALLCTLSIVLQNVLFVALAAWLVRRCLVQKKSLGFPAWGWVWIAFTAWALMACLNAPNEVNSLVNWRKWLLAVTAWCVADAVEDERRLRGLLGTLLVGAALVNLGAALCYGPRPLLAWIHGMPWAEVSSRWVMDYGVQWRARGGSGGYMVLAACDSLILLFFSGLAIEDGSWRRASVYACLAAIGLGLLLTMTRGAWIATGLGLGLLLLWRRPLWGLGLGLALALVVLLAPGSVFVQRFKTVGDLNLGSNRERLYMAQTGMAILKDHPWIGVGDSLAGFDKTGLDGRVDHDPGYFLRYRSPEATAWFRANIDTAGQQVGHLHDVPLQLVVMYGFPGLALALLFFAGLITWGLRLKGRARTPQARGAGLGLAAGLTAFFIHGITEYNLGAFQTAFTLWFVIGLAASAARLDGGAGSAPGSPEIP